MEEPKTPENRQCVQELMELRDSFDALVSKWKLPILQYLYNRQDEQNNFRKIAHGIKGISDKMLAKELKNLEQHHLIISAKPDAAVTQLGYRISEHGKTAIPVIKTLVNWGKEHRVLTKKLMGAVPPDR